MVSKLGEGYYDNNELVPTGKEEKEQYFYFQDHLGSSTYITDLNGDIAQYTAYTPYGEPFVETRSVSPYKFIVIEISFKKKNLKALNYCLFMLILFKFAI